MIKENIEVTNQKLNALAMKVTGIQMHFSNYKSSDTFVTMTPSQKTTAITKFTELDTALETAITEYRAARDATEKIVEEPKE